MTPERGPVIVAKEAEAHGEELEKFLVEEGALIEAPELTADCIAGQEEFKLEDLADPSLEELQQMSQKQEAELTPDKTEQVVWDKKLLY